MARTLSDIYTSIVNEKNSQSSLNALQPAIDDEQTLLSDITTTSKVADWRLWCYIVSVAIWVHENLWDLFKAEIDAIVASAIPGTARWYQEQALLFQYGDPLVWLDYKFQYAIIDATKQIIQRSAVIEIGGNVVIKVAKLVSGAPAKLNAFEIAAFQAYLNDIKFAGTGIAIISYDPDLLKLSFDVTYDPLVLASDGSLLTDATTFPVEDVINDYIKNIIWAGVFNETKVIDAIQLAAGVVDAIITGAEGKAYNGNYAAINQNYQSIAGYMKIDPAFPLSGTITYIPNV